MTSGPFPPVPAAQKMPVPGAAVTEASWPLPPGSGLGATAQEVPFQNTVRVCGAVAPDGVSEPTAHRPAAKLPAMPVSAGLVPLEGEGTTLQLVPFQCSISVPTELPKGAVASSV